MSQPKKFDKVKLLTDLVSRTPRDRAVFAACCTQRLAPSFVRFSEESKLADAKLFEQLLDRIWHDLEAEEPDTETLTSLALRVESLILGEDVGIGKRDRNAAEDAGVALAYTYECRLTTKSEPAVWAAQRVLSAIDDFVITAENIDMSIPSGAKAALGHPLVQSELRHQAQDMFDLEQKSLSVQEMRVRASLPENGAIPP